MTNKEAYWGDLDNINHEISRILSLVPVGKTAKEKEFRRMAEEAASVARVTVDCMRNDYIPLENIFC